MFDTSRNRRAGSAHDAARRRLEALSSSLAGELGELHEAGAEGPVEAPARPGRHAARQPPSPETHAARERGRIRAYEEGARLTDAQRRGDVAGDLPSDPRPSAQEDDRATDGETDAQPAADSRSGPGRRVGHRWVDRLPLPVRSAVWGRFGAHHLAVLAVVLATALCLAAWWALSARPQVQAVPPTVSPASPVPAPTSAPAPGAAESQPTSTPSPGSSPTPTSAGDATGEQLVIVDVAGKVRRSGIVTLPWGSRVADALEAAGGARPGVDLVTLNLARVLVDGEQLLVGIEAATAPAPTVPGPTVVPEPGATPGSPTALVNLNTATLADLDTLPGVGPVTAEAILTWRTENGAFSTVDELLEVSGIGDVTLEELRDLVTV